jgi:hypothetical protein
MRRDVERVCGDDPRFKAVTSERLRQDLSYDYIDLRSKAEREERRRKREDAMKGTASLRA